MTKYLSINCLFIFYILIWDPLHNLVLKFDGAGKLVFLLGIVIFFKCLFARKGLFSKPLIYYFIWLIYMFINSSLKGVSYFDNSYYLLFQNIFLPFVFFWIILNETLIQRTIILNTVIFSLFIYLALVVLFGGINYDDRLDSALNANAVGLRAAFLFFFIILKFSFKQIDIRPVALLSIFPTLIIFLTQSRTAFGVFLILLISFVYILWERINRKLRILAFTSLIFCLLVFVYIIFNNTSIGDRLASTTTQSSESKLLVTDTNWDYLGDRGLQYVLAGPIIEDNLIFGIGLRNFLDYSITDTVLHSEYLINLCEGGLIGFILYLLFHYWIGHNLYKVWKANIRRHVTVVFIAGFVSIFFLSWVTRVCYYPFYYGYYGMLVAFIYRVKIIQIRSWLFQKKRMFKNLRLRRHRVFDL